MPIASVFTLQGRRMLVQMIHFGVHEKSGLFIGSSKEGRADCEFINRRLAAKAGVASLMLAQHNYMTEAARNALLEALKEALGTTVSAEIFDQLVARADDHNLWIFVQIRLTAGEIIKAFAKAPRLPNQTPSDKP